LIIAIPQLPQNTIERYWSGVVDWFELYLTEQTRDFSGIGSLIVWELHITIYSNNTTFTEQDIPLWSVFYESTNTLLPFPVSIYSNTNNILVYDCSREWVTAVCPSNNPLVCALWGFFRIVYDLLMNILPAPVRSVFSLFSVLGGVLTSILSVFTNPLFLSIVLLLFPLLLLTLVTHETVERGGFGLINVFNELFNTIKHIVELIVNMIRSVLPF
jgi:phage-related protein